MKTLFLVILSMIPLGLPSDFFEKQLKFERVARSYASKGKDVDKLLSAKSINMSDFDLFLRALKQEKKLEIWAKNKKQSTYKLIKTYDFCVLSGDLGPKRCTGDKQVPEGVYQVTNFNPQSNYHLSFKINYPNQSDLVLSDKKNPGSDIYIHGDCVSIGCIPLGNDNIEELYLLAAKAKNAGRPIHVHIFPSYLDEEPYTALKKRYKADKDLLVFWANLKPIYDSFEKSKKLPAVTVDLLGKYVIR